ncbi:LINE-1 retrotransposable element ORF2 protein [Spodoptera frugiperda]|uniref:LINE-1 retrotransposable element ORF2 protein n=1 Tax=Spodoptera frugiperda TaxID=7108 RepID=A0A9R0EED0_SPOFR|nr:LINE-1 retrotransposable element ORF2 protein [Spodoptera frugiperda]
MHLPAYKHKWSIVQIYAPTEQHNESTKDIFYDQLSSVLQETHKNVMVIGDFNGRIGMQQTGEENVIGNFGFGRRSKNGERMINMAFENNLAFMNSFFRINTKKKWTWHSPDGSYKNEIDYIATNNRKLIQNVNILSQFNFNTNHRMVRAVLKWTEQKKSRSKYNIPTNNLKQQLEIKSKIDNYYEKEINEIFGSSQNILTKPKKNYTENETKTLIEERRSLLKLKKDKHNLKAISEISKKISNSIKKDRTKKRINTINYHIKKTGGVKKALNELVESKNWIPNIRNKNGKQETKRGNIIQIATDFYKTLYAAEPNTKEAVTNIEDEDIEDIPDFIQSEIEKAIQSQKTDKAPGPDKITNEILKLVITAPDKLKKLKDMYNTILRTELIPSQWAKSTIVLLHKKGDRDNIENYRPISLMSNLYKVFAKLILNRLTGLFDQQQPMEQAGFRAGFSTIDHMHVLKQLIEKSAEYGKALYIAFVDYSKAFDSIYHNSLWKALVEQGVPKKYIRIIKSIYETSTAQIKLETTGEEFRIAKGVRQGDPLSPKLFSAILESVFRGLEWENVGINIDGKKLNHLRFADDLVLTADNATTLQHMLQQLSEASRTAGLTMNGSKTKETLIDIEIRAIEYS